MSRLLLPTARYGLFLFLVYLLTYAGFICLAVLKTDALGIEVFLGINLAIVYGMALILLALLLAIIYMWLCRRAEAEARPVPPDEEP